MVIYRKLNTIWGFNLKRLDKIHSILSQALKPISIKITDDSDLHVGHAEASGAGETHFRLETRLTFSSRFLMGVIVWKAVVATGPNSSTI